MHDSTKHWVFKGVGLLDYAYLALNVYYDPKDDALLGKRPHHLQTRKVIKALHEGKHGWFRFAYPQLAWSQVKVLMLTLCKTL